MFCEQCGKELPDNARFCSNCGNVIQENPEQGNPAGAKGVKQKSESKRQKHIPSPNLNPELKEKIGKTGTEAMEKGKGQASVYLQKWKNLNSMDGKGKGIWIGGHAGILFLICLFLLLGRGSKEVEWEGYRADMEAGKWVKEVQYGDSCAQFDLDGNVTYYKNGDSQVQIDLSGNVTYYKREADDDPLAEKLEGTLPFKPEISISESSVKWDVVTYNLIPASLDKESSYYYDAENEIRASFGDEGKECSYKYTIINGVKLVVAASWRGTIYDWGKFEYYDCDIEDQYTYNADGKITNFLQIQYLDNEAPRRVEYSIDYDDAGNIVKASEAYTKEGTITRWYYEYTYDEEGRPTSAGLYKHANIMDVSWRLYDELTREYDEAGNLISATNRNSTGKRIMTYDEMGNMISSIKYDENGEEKYKAIWSYDEKGNMTSEVYSEDGNEKYKNVYIYDRKGNQTCHEYYTVYGDKEYIKEKNEYKYDRNGNIKARRRRSYEYEANSDFSVVNQTKVSDSWWENYSSAKTWTVIYYTNEEVKTYQHNQQFKKL